MKIPESPAFRRGEYVKAEYFGPGARHDNDYTFYYNNIKANVAKRIAAYKASK